MSPANYLNFEVDHMTMLMDPKLYRVSYLILRNIFGVAKDGLMYEKRKEWEKGQGERSLTFAVSLGSSLSAGNDMLNKTLMALVQPSEPEGARSHVRETLQLHKASAHWQHIALRTPDLLAFHKHAIDRGVNFVTPILKDDLEDLIQVFSGEWYHPGSAPSGVFFEFVQRNPNDATIQRIEEHNRESYFRDETFLGLYGEKERESQSGKILPFIDPELHKRLDDLIGKKRLFEITEDDVQKADTLMLEFGESRKKARA